MVNGFDDKNFSVSKVIETGHNFERINKIDLNIAGDAIISIVYYHTNEYNKPKDEIVVIFYFTEVLETEINIGTTAVDFFDKYIGCVTVSEDDSRYCHNLFWHMINHGWLVSNHYLEENNLSAYDYYPKTHYCFQYDEYNDKTTRKIKVIIN